MLPINQKGEVKNPNTWPCITIITPSFNQAQFLEEAIRSVLLQNYPNLEYILIDGGSTDGSLEIIRKYAPRLAYWVSEPDRGQSHAINKGFARTTGEIITFLSSDDYYLPGALHEVAQHWLANPGSGAYVGAFQFLDPGSGSLGPPIPPRLDKPSPLDLSLGPPGVYRLHQVATFYTRQALDVVGRYVREDMHYVMDRELLYRVARAYPIHLSHKPYGAFRRHPGSKSGAEHILPFAGEFARLYLDSQDGDIEKDRLRRRMARYRLGKGYLNYARSVGGGRAIPALLQAARQYPAYLSRRSYYATWARTIFNPGGTQRAFPEPSISQ